MLAWMAWTWQTALFFCLIGLALLGFPTQRGDRFFVSLVGSAFIFILWMRFGGGELWYPLAASVVYGAAMFKFA